MSKKRKHQLKDEVVYSPVHDKGIQKNIKGSKIWNECYHKEDIPAKFQGYAYRIAFDGVTPIQVKSVKRV